MLDYLVEDFFELDEDEANLHFSTCFRYIWWNWELKSCSDALSIPGFRIEILLEVDVENRNPDAAGARAWRIDVENRNSAVYFDDANQNPDLHQVCMWWIDVQIQNCFGEF
jgi:hypothetical protein